MGVKCSLLPVTRPPRCGISTAIKRCRLPRSYWMHFGDSIWIRCVLRGVLYTSWFKRHGSDLYALKWHRSDQCNGSVNGGWGSGDAWNWPLPNADQICMCVAYLPLYVWPKCTDSISTSTNRMYCRHSIGIGALDLRCQPSHKRTPFSLTSCSL